MINFAKRNTKELLRDPMSLIFCIGLPLFLLVIFQQFNIPAEQFSIQNFTPGIIVFSYSFISLFTAQLVSSDRATSLLSRLFASPMKGIDYIVGYSLALLPIVIIQSVLFFGVGLLFGLGFSINIVYTLLILMPVSLLFIGLGILIGSIAKANQAPAIGSLVIQLVSFTSGMWFSIDMVGKIYQIICKILPFSYAVDITKNMLNGNFNLLDVIILVIYIIVIYTLTIIVFNKKKTSDNK